MVGYWAEESIAQEATARKMGSPGGLTKRKLAASEELAHGLGQPPKWPSG